jgi:hypothetical protein
MPHAPGSNLAPKLGNQLPNSEGEGELPEHNGVGIRGHLMQQQVQGWAHRSDMSLELIGT